jgi:adenosylmethionine-8-amino-7-oxononanoate aminotransferase
MMAGIELVADRETKAAFPSTERRGWRVCRGVRERGVLLRLLGDIVVVMPPLAISLDEIDQIMHAVAAEIDVATA